MSLQQRTVTDTILVHCSATQPHHDVTAKEIDRWHRKRGFFQIGYHYVIRRDGTLEYGRPVGTVGAHCRNAGMNRRSVGVCLVGGVDSDLQPEDNFTPIQFHALSHLIIRLTVEYPHAAVLGHREVPGVAKACPSFDVSEWLHDHFNDRLPETWLLPNLSPR